MFGVIVQSAKVQKLLEVVKLSLIAQKEALHAHNDSKSLTAIQTINNKIEELDKLTLITTFGDHTIIGEDHYWILSQGSNAVNLVDASKITTS